MHFESNVLKLLKLKGNFYSSAEYKIKFKIYNYYAG